HVLDASYTCRFRSTRIRQRNKFGGFGEGSRSGFSSTVETLSHSPLTNKQERKTNRKEKTMTATTRKLNIRRNFRRAKLDDLQARAHTVFTNMGASVGVFTTPPIPLATLKQDSDNLATSHAAAKEGGPKEIAQREKDRLTLEHDLDLLGSYALK